MNLHSQAALKGQVLTAERIRLLVMPKNDTYRLSPRVSYEFAGDRSILMLEDVGEVYLCNATLTEFLRILDGRLSIIEIAQLLLEKYDSSRDVIARDLHEAAGELARKGILENV